jgi:hypothetical protein
MDIISGALVDRILLLSGFCNIWQQERWGVMCFTEAATALAGRVTGAHRTATLVGKS